MKYESIFGDQSLFDGAPEDAEYAGWFCQEVRWYMILNGKILFSDGGSWCTSDNPYLSADIAAMRRIIAEPKCWTVEDKKAERLPEVGCKVDTFIGECMIIGADLNLKHVAVQYHDGYMDILHISKIKPIETPEDKSQRKEDEFVSLVESEYNKMPNEISFRAGIRAAYRKLKGGE